MSLPCPKNASELLDMYYLEARCHLLETAAIFDRLRRAPGAAAAADDPRYRRLRAALDILASDRADKAAAFLDAFSEE